MEQQRSLTAEEVKAEFIRILHNVHEHTEHLHDIITKDVASPRVMEKLKHHIALEDSKSIEDLNILDAAAGDDLKHERTVLRDHLGFHRDIATTDEIADELAAELLHHFIEEHEYFFKSIGGDMEYSGEERNKDFRETTENTPALKEEDHLEMNQEKPEEHGETDSRESNPVEEESYEIPTVGSLR